jgi:hypothetical protein
MQIIHILGCSKEQLYALEKAGFGCSKNGGLDVVHLTITKQIEDNMAEIGRILRETNVEHDS